MEIPLHSPNMFQCRKRPRNKYYRSTQVLARKPQHRTQDGILLFHRGTSIVIPGRKSGLSISTSKSNHNGDTETVATHSARRNQPIGLALTFVDRSFGAIKVSCWLLPSSPHRRLPTRAGPSRPRTERHTTRCANTFLQGFPLFGRVSRYLVSVSP